MLILLGLLGNWFGRARIVYQWAMGAALAAAVLELARVTGGSFRPFVEWAGGWLPLYSYGLGWIAPSAIGFALGLLLRRRGAAGKPRKPGNLTEPRPAFPAGTEAMEEA